MWAEYSIKKLKPLQQLRRFQDGRGIRFYLYLTGEGEVKISAGVTSVMGVVSTERKGIDGWKAKNDNWEELLDAAAEYGTGLHTQYAKLLLNEPVDKTVLDLMRDIAVANGQSYDMASKDLLSFLKFKEDYNVKPLVVEGMLLWKDENGEELSMTIDLLAEISTTIKTKTEVEDGKYLRGANKGKPKFKTVVTEKVEKRVVLVDFKSNFFEKDRKTFYETHLMQLIAARLAVEQNFDIKVDGLFNFAPSNTWRTSPDYTFKEWTPDDSDIELFKAYWRVAVLKGLNKPKGTVFVVDEFKNSADFKLLDYPTFVKEVLLKDEVK